MASSFKYRALLSAYSISSLILSFQTVGLKIASSEELTRQAGKSLEEIYRSAFQNAPFSQIDIMFSEDNNVRANMENDYLYFVDALEFNENEVGIKNTEFYNMTGTPSYESYESGSYIDVTLDFEHTVDFAVKDFWSGDINIESNSGFGDAVFFYMLENGKWVLCDYELPDY